MDTVFAKSELALFRKTFAELKQRYLSNLDRVEEDELLAKLEKEDAANLKPNVGVTGKTASKPKRSSRANGGAANPAGKTTAVQAKKSSGPRKSKAPAGKAPAKKTPRKAVRKKGGSE